MGSAAGTLVALCLVPLRHPWLRSDDGIRGLALGTRRMVGDTLKIRKVIISVIKGKKFGALGRVSRKSRKHFGHEKPFVKNQQLILQSRYFNISVR